MRERAKYLLKQGKYDQVIQDSRGCKDPIAHLKKKDYINLVVDVTQALELTESSSKATLLTLRDMSTLKVLRNLLKGKGMINQDSFNGQQNFIPPQTPLYLPVIQINDYYLNPNQNNQPQIGKKRKIHEIQNNNSLNFPKKSSDINFFNLKLGQSIEKASFNTKCSNSVFKL